MTLNPNEIYLAKSSSVIPLKVYVVEAERTDELDDSYICGVYSSIDKAVDKVKSIKSDPDYECYISVFDLDDGDDVTDETWIREFEPDDIEVYREAFPSNESIMVVVKWTHEGQKCSRGFAFYNVPSDENDETKYTFAQNVTDILAHMLGEYLNDTYGVNLMVGQPARDKIKMKIMEMI